MFPYTEPTSHEEVITYMTRLGAPTRTTVPRTGTVLPAYATRPWAQPPASIAFYAPDYIGVGPVVKYLHGSTPRNQPANPAHDIWLPAFTRVFGTRLGLDWRIPSNTWEADLANREFIFMDKLATHLGKAGIKRSATAGTIMLFWSLINVRVFDPRQSLQKYRMSNEESWTALLQVARVVADTRLTADQRRDVLQRGIDNATLEELLGRGIPYPLIRDMYPVPTWVKYSPF